jgi:hypothetical protein
MRPVGINCAWPISGGTAPSVADLIVAACRLR